jgi:hypothetical protein
MLSAHEASLPLLEVLREKQGCTTVEAATALRGTLEGAELLSDVRAVITFSDGTSYVNLEPVTAFGADVLVEVASSSEFIPCPPDECEFLPGGYCRWCGAPAQRS